MRSLKNQRNLPDGGFAFHAADGWLDLIALAERDHDFPSGAQCVNMWRRVIVRIDDIAHAMHSEYGGRAEV